MFFLYFLINTWKKKLTIRCTILSSFKPANQQRKFHLIVEIISELKLIQNFAASLFWDICVHGLEAAICPKTIKWEQAFVKLSKNYSKNDSGIK